MANNLKPSERNSEKTFHELEIGSVLKGIKKSSWKY
jgi:hypothetical protein